MYPGWLICSFTNNPCTVCRAPITVDEITAIGWTRPEDYEAYLREPLALVLAKCRQCGQKHSFRMRCEKDSLIDAMHELADRIASAPSGSPPPLGPGAPAARSADDTPERTPDEKSPVRPSVRADQKLGPPSQEEIKSFLARLKRMSFKPGSKSFKKLSGPDHGADDQDKRNDRRKR
jgi:hypothetical protein